ncbi:MAG: sigma-70 family RNA polymerase sigma factor [Clostridiales bacterium]|jgi:RNA polymerase sigma factor (sigma-70 family)|nr:sigma-70 family RNA polymerase sigma factor [Eubacteriales bacterium]MDH7566519.1 sigma-70 family RNA polymerase sigma factor [Clostridiales bacterium]
MKKKDEEIEKMFDAYIKSTIRKARRDFDRQKQKRNMREILMGEADVDIPVAGPGEREIKVEDILLYSSSLDEAIMEFEDTISNDLLFEALRSLSTRQKEVIYMRCLLKYTVPRISRLLGISETQVKKLNNKAFHKLSSHLNSSERKYRHYGT